MSIIRLGIQKLKKEGIQSFASSGIRYTSLPIWNTVTSRQPVGTNIFTRDWDLLVILDSCRCDALKEASKNKIEWHEFERMRSVGSMSAEWMLNTFTQKHIDEIKDTAFVSGNIWSHRIFKERFHEYTNHSYNHLHRGVPNWQPVTTDDFAHYETVYSIANQADRVHPENDAIPHILTDRTISVGRTKDFNRLIVHYTLPHQPFIADAIAWEAEKTSIDELMNGPEVIRELRPYEKTYKPAALGEVKRETVWKSYLQNLHLGLDYVNILLENFDANRVVISADHGEGFGEKGVWGHPFGWPFSPVKTVPWARTTATDEETYQTKYERLNRNPSEQEREEFLKNMGYI